MYGERFFQWITSGLKDLPDWWINAYVGRLIYNEWKKEVLMTSWNDGIRPNKSVHLEMLSHLGEEQTKISKTV